MKTDSLICDDIGTYAYCGPAAAPVLPASSGLVCILRSWLQSWSSDTYQSSVARHDAARPNSQPVSSVRVLVADDNPLHRMEMAALLEAKGLVPFLAKDGAEAVALACKTHFDLILMDLLMPILDGLRATDAIRRYENACSQPAVPVVAYSSLSPGARVLADHGLTGRLAKPCDDQDLEDCLLQWCPNYFSGH